MLKRKAMQAVISKHGWDGEWFRRAYDAFGKPIGSKQCAEGKIFIESQGWGIILGVRPSAEGLVVDPCIPRKWKGFKVHRVFRGKTYHITVKNPDGHSKGVKKLLQRYIYP
jgi:cellobiose phosphorylase